MHRGAPVRRITTSTVVRDTVAPLPWHCWRRTTLHCVCSQNVYILYIFYFFLASLFCAFQTNAHSRPRAFFPAPSTCALASRPQFETTPIHFSHPFFRRRAPTTPDAPLFFSVSFSAFSSRLPPHPPSDSRLLAFWKRHVRGLRGTLRMGQGTARARYLESARRRVYNKTATVAGRTATTAPATTATAAAHVARAVVVVDHHVRRRRHGSRPAVRTHARVGGAGVDGGRARAHGERRNS